MVLRQKVVGGYPTNLARLWGKLNLPSLRHGAKNNRRVRLLDHVALRQLNYEFCLYKCSKRAVIVVNLVKSPTIIVMVILSIK